MAYLLTQFEAHLTELNPKSGAIVGQELEKLQMFVRYARKFLTENRLQGIFPEEDNYGLLLSNGARVMVCPPGAVSYEFDSINNVDTSGAIRVTRHQ